MRSVSRIYTLYLLLFVFLFLIGCSDTSQKDNIKKIKPQQNIVQKKEHKPESSNDKTIMDPFTMYLFNKKNTAKLQVESARITNQSSPKEENYFQKKRMDSMREYFTKGNYDVARKHAEQLMADPSISNTMKAEIYFMMAQITKTEYGESSALDLVGKAYEQMKKISEDPEIKQKVNNFNELGNNINELNDFVPPEEPEEDLE